MNAIDTAITAMPARAHAAVDALIGALTARMLIEPWRINAAITGMTMWPPEDTLADLLRWCRDSLADERECARMGFERRSTFKIESIRAAARALRVLIEREAA